ncbi:MAG TPA: FixH family protein, partial [Woeseiaceae bacterium]|nr:FixH family protein [Woeseiaceae bacterium]
MKSSGLTMVLAGLGVAVLAVIAYGLLQRDAAPEPTSSEDALERYHVGQVEMGIAVDPATPRVGDNRVIIELEDAQGKPVTGAAIDAFAEMPAMGQMPAMRAPADMTEVAPGRYEGTVDLAMRGAWPLTVTLEDPETGAPSRLRFDLATDRPGLALATGGAPAGGKGAANDTSNAITVDNRRRQLIGLETGEATYRELVSPIRAVGEVTYDERLLSQITLKFDGYIGDLKADYVGAPIAAGQELFTVYSPEVLAAQQEYLEVVHRRAAAGAKDGLVRAARQRLRLWDLSDEQIEALERRGIPSDYVSIDAPRSGTLIERHIADGSAAKMGQTLLMIADLSRVWIDAEVFEADLELIHEDMKADVRLPYLPGQQFEATVEYVYPYLEGDTRTGRMRLTLDNPSGVLKPEMYAEVSVQVDLGELLSVPEEAVIVAGDSRVVFVDLGDGRLNPVRIRTGRRAQGFVEVLAGLSPGDRIVTSGNFLIAA